MEEAQEPARGDATERVSAPAPPAEEGGISLHNFSWRLAEHLVNFHAMRLQDSLFLWVGDRPELSNLAVAMCTPRDSIPASALLFGNASDNTSNCLAQRLASKTKKQIFVSYNVQNTDNGFILLVENRIKEEMAAFPDKF
ncbi:proteasome assembly chaperone 4 [Ahaetulla prasina]|uniref:proteasome assembly chaperone 4 n=1 Tax=Ahaetulla prasina TaxID=499056 RepID=UPI00264A443C|nr:proteasome assembly chaperone 4 [Ahaetulla prasina]